MAIQVDKSYHVDDMRCARATIDKEFKFVIADESFYAFAGSNSMYPLDAIVSEDDLDEFRRVFAEDDHAPILIKMRRADDVYRLCMLTLLNSDVVINGIDMYEIEVRDVINLSNVYSRNHEHLVKYRGIMSVLPEKFFEYDIKTGLFRIFEYEDGNSRLIEKDNLEEWKNRVIRLGQVDDKNKVLLEQLCDNLRQGLDRLSITLVTSFLKKGESDETVKFVGISEYFDGEKSMIVGIIDIDPERKEKRQYRSMFNGDRDSATGLFNKRSIAELSTNRVNLYREEYADDNSKKLYIVIADIDNFKTVNDTYGHYFGDQVISKFAATIKDVVGNRGYAGRIGGDEFFVILEGVNSREELQLVLKTIRKKMYYAFPNMSPNYVFTCSIGVSEFRKDAMDYDTLFRLADKALYIAKEKGRNRFIIYDKAMHGSLEDDGDIDKRIVANTGISMRSFERIKECSEVLDRLDKVTNENIRNIIQELIPIFGINGITVFGNDYSPRFVVGEYENDRLDADYMKTESYSKNFNEIGMYVINNVEGMQIENPVAYDILKKNDICSSIQVIIGDGKDFRGVVSFDITGQKSKWNDKDILLLYVIAKRIGNVLDRLK